MFQKITESQTSGLQLVKPDVTKKFYQIVSDDGIFATIDLIHGQGSLARLETIDGSYTIKRQGFFFPYVTLRRESDQTDVATVLLDRHGQMSFAIEGVLISFKQLALWKNQWGWVNEKNKCVMRFMLTNAGLVRGDVEISKDFYYLPHLELVAASGAYFLLQLEDELASLAQTK